MAGKKTVNNGQQVGSRPQPKPQQRQKKKKAVKNAKRAQTETKSEAPTLSTKEKQAKAKAKKAAKERRKLMREKKKRQRERRRLREQAQSAKPTSDADASSTEGANEESDEESDGESDSSGEVSVRSRSARSSSSRWMVAGQPAPSSPTIKQNARTTPAIDIPKRIGKLFDTHPVPYPNNDPSRPLPDFWAMIITRETEAIMLSKRRRLIDAMWADPKQQRRLQQTRAWAILQHAMEHAYSLGRFNEFKVGVPPEWLQMLRTGPGTLQIYPSFWSFIKQKKFMDTLDQNAWRWANFGQHKIDWVHWLHVMIHYDFSEEAGERALYVGLPEECLSYWYPVPDVPEPERARALHRQHIDACNPQRWQYFEMSKEEFEEWLWERLEEDRERAREAEAMREEVKEEVRLRSEAEMQEQQSEATRRAELWTSERRSAATTKSSQKVIEVVEISDDSDENAAHIKENQNEESQNEENDDEEDGDEDDDDHDESMDDEDSEDEDSSADEDDSMNEGDPEDGSEDGSESEAMDTESDDDSVASDVLRG